MSLNTACSSLKSISRGEVLIKKCPYCIVEDHEKGEKLITCNELNKAHREFCDAKWEEVGGYQ